jgi:hypothetical protein
MLVVKAHPREPAQHLARRIRHGKGAVAIDRIGDTPELAADDAGEIRHLLADQQIGFPTGEVRQHMAGRQLELDALQMAAQPRQAAGEKRGHRLAGGDAHGAVGSVAGESGDGSIRPRAPWPRHRPAAPRRRR